MKLHAFRVKDGENLYQAIEEKLQGSNIKASFIVGGAAGFKAINLRLPTLPGQGPTLQKAAKYELVSITGGVGIEHMHIHVSVSDEKGRVFGGHLLREGNIVRNTAEIGILEADNLLFSREMDENTGWKELVIKDD